MFVRSSARRTFSPDGSTDGVARPALALAIAVLVSACGAKTGLYVPDGDVDAGFDAGVDAMDAGPDTEPPPCIEVPRDVGPVRTSLAIPVELAVVDVMFLLDATASMLDEIDTIRRRLQDRVVPGVREAIPDAAFGVALVGEFPVMPHGPRSVQPYDLRAPITTDVLRIESALERLPSWGNFDEPEAQVEGLYQVATGAGLDPWITPSAGCPAGGFGGACFRRESLSVVLLITDAPMNNGPPADEDYRFDGPHLWPETRSVLRSANILVIGLGARDAFAMSPMRDLRAVAQDTGAIDADGSPLAFDIGGGGGGVGNGIVRAIQRLAAGLPLDVDAIVEDEPGDIYDARLLVQEVRALSANPPTGITGREGDLFVGVTPGTEVTFEIVLDPSVIPPSPETIVIPARVLFRAFRRSRIDRQDVVFVIPGEGGGCDTVAP
ncbi:MAG: hypothetical protein AAGE52_18735 [Myxococcota bacterium]